MLGPLRRLFFVGLFATVLLTAACLLSSTCPCGEDFERDPFDPTAEFYVGADHNVGDHCLCRCGPDGDEERMPPSNSCDGYEAECQREDGAADVYECR